MSTNSGAKTRGGLWRGVWGAILTSSQFRGNLRLRSVFGVSELKIEEDPREGVSFGY